jgi:hypothetical protein
MFQRRHASHKSPLWGKYDLSFELSEPEAYRRDVSKAEVHILDAGHFALDTAADQIALIVRSFMKERHEIQDVTLRTDVGHDRARDLNREP